MPSFSADSINEQVPDEMDLVASMADTLLGNVSHNRIRRLAKAIMVSVFEFLLALLTLFFFDLVGNTQSHNDPLAEETMVSCSGLDSVEQAKEVCFEKPTRGALYVVCTTTTQDTPRECRVEGTLMLSPATAILMFLVGVYAIGLAVWSYRRAKRATSTENRMTTNATFRTTPELEAAYAQTNDWPFVDGILEVPLTVRYLGYPIPVLLWGFNGLCVVAVVAAWTAPNSDNDSEEDNDRPGMIFSSVLAMVQMYRISANVSELLVLTSAKGLLLLQDEEDEKEENDKPEDDDDCENHPHQGSNDENDNDNCGQPQQDEEEEDETSSCSSSRRADWNTEQQVPSTGNNHNNNSGSRRVPSLSFRKHNNKAGSANHIADSATPSEYQNDATTTKSPDQEIPTSPPST